MIVRRRLATVLTLGVGAAALVLAPSAMAGGGEPVKDKDECEKSSVVKLKVVPDGGNFEVVGVVWSDDDDIWDWKMKHNGDESAEGDVKAKDADKSFKITRTMVDFVGPDKFVFRADNRRTGEVCRAALTY